MAKPQISRVNGVMFVAVIIIATLVLRLAYMQIIQWEHYTAMARNNVSRPVVKPAPRGLILDRNGVVIARNELRFDLGIMIDPRTNWQQTFKEIADFLVERGIWTRGHDGECEQENCDETCIVQRRFSAAKAHRRFQDAFILERNISKELMFELEENSWKFPYMQLVEIPVRYYEEGRFFPNLLQGMKSDRTPKRFSIESTWDEFLRGEDGYERILVNNRSVPRGLIDIKDPTPGKNLILTIDAELQRHTQRALVEGIENQQQIQMQSSRLPAARHGAAIVIDVRTGDILALANYPDFDVTELYTLQLRNQMRERDEILNRHVRFSTNSLPQTDIDVFYPLWNTFGPGSTIKILTSIIALEEGVVTPNQRFNDRGSYNSIREIGNNGRPLTISNANNRIFGSVNLKEAFQVSLNTFFAYIVDNIRPRLPETREVIKYYANMFGLTGGTGFTDVSGHERTGAVFVRGRHTQSPIQFTIGATSTINVSPMHMANFVSMVANRGHHFKPRLVREIVDVNGNIIHRFEPEIYRSIPYGAVSDSTYDVLIDAMKLVTRFGPRQNGTSAAAFRNFPIEVAAKTGSAASSWDAHSWWVGFAPADEPEIAVVVFTEHGGMNSHTHFIARAIMDKYFGFIVEETEDGSDE